MIWGPIPPWNYSWQFLLLSWVNGVVSRPRELSEPRTAMRSRSGKVKSLVPQSVTTARRPPTSRAALAATEGDVVQEISSSIKGQRLTADW